MTDHPDHPNSATDPDSPDSPDAPDPTGDAADSTLGGYFDVHDRPPGFEGRDGLPYTVSIEVEQTGDLLKPFAGYLVFPRWAGTGLGIIGHVQTEVLWEGKGTEEVRNHANALGLLEVQNLLNAAIEREEER